MRPAGQHAIIAGQPPPSGHQLYIEIMTALQTWKVVAICELPCLPSAASQLPESNCKKEGHGEES